jgi:hypothetical protein
MKARPSETVFNGYHQGVWLGARRPARESRRRNATNPRHQATVNDGLAAEATLIVL